MKIQDLFETEEMFNSDELIRAITTVMNDLDDDEAAIADLVSSRITQSFPDEVSADNIREILNEPAVIDAQEENDGIDAKEVLNDIFDAAGIEIKV